MARNAWDDDPDVDEPGMSEAKEVSPLYGGSGASLGVGAPESLWDKARSAVSSALFGDSGRAEAKAAGVGLQPTPAELLQGAGMIAAPMAGPSLVAAGGRAVAGLGGAGNIASRTISGVQGAKRGYKMAGPIGAIGGGVIGAVNPVSTGTVEGAITGYETGGIPAAIGGALIGAIGGGGADKVAKVAKLLKTAQGIGKAATATEALPAAAEAIQAVEQAAPTAKASFEAGKAAFDASKTAAREFAKSSGSKKVGEKIWMLLDEAGQPLKTLTPDQAGAAARAGKATTWVKNTWS